jgi:DNA-directed RNA polymerase subunit RPC12/RpoP
VRFDDLLEMIAPAPSQPRGGLVADPHNSPGRRRTPAGGPPGPGRLRSPGSLPGFGFDQLKSRESRSRADELQYFMVSTSCVRCKKTVQASVDKLHYKLRCPHCGTLMHLREDGKWYEGVHPSLQTGPGAGRWKRLAESARRRFPWLTHRITVLVPGMLVLGGVAWGVTHALSGRDRQIAPAKLEARADWVCRAVQAGNPASLRVVAAPESHDESEEWMGLVRERLSAAAARYGPTTEIRLDVLYQNWQEGHAAVSAHFASGEGEGVKCVLFWDLDDEQYWVLDGARTLRDLGTGAAR